MPYLAAARQCPRCRRTVAILPPTAAEPQGELIEHDCDTRIALRALGERLVRDADTFYYPARQFPGLADDLRRMADHLDAVAQR